MGRCISVWNRVSFLIEKSRKMSIPTFPIITRKKRIFAPRRKIWWKVFWKKVFFQQSFEKKLFWKIFFSKNLSKKSFSPKTFLDQDGFLVFSRFLLLKIDFKKIKFLYATKVSNLFCIQKISELSKSLKSFDKKTFFHRSHIYLSFIFLYWETPLTTPLRLCHASDPFKLQVPGFFEQPVGFFLKNF